MVNQSEQHERRRSLLEALSAMREGDLSQTRLARLSDLSRDGARTLSREWPSLPEDVRIGIVRHCEELTEERIDLDFRRALRVALNDSSPVVRQLAVSGLWEDESNEVLEQLRRIMHDDQSPDVRAEAAAALGRFSQSAASGSLENDLGRALRAELLYAATGAEAPYALQRRALESLGPFADDDLVATAIEEAFESGDQGLQCSAIYAMGLSRNPRWLPMVLSELQSDEAELRYEAARSAGLLGSADGLPLLIDAARDDDAEVRHTAINAIGQIGGRGAVRALERLADDAGEADLELIDSVIEEVNVLIKPLQPAL